ncbi:uncharacterized protein METZ01_LOCUS232446, partial [marine metagenome]
SLNYKNITITVIPSNLQNRFVESLLLAELLLIWSFDARNTFKEQTTKV